MSALFYNDEPLFNNILVQLIIKLNFCRLLIIKKSDFVKNKIGQSQLFHLVAIFGIVFTLLSTYLFGKREATGRTTYNLCQGTSQIFQVILCSNLKMRLVLTFFILGM